MGMFLLGLAFPVVVIGSTIILIIRLGWPGAVGIVVLMLVVPISNAISKNNGSIIQ
jgi:hypothetical protein